MRVTDEVKLGYDDVLIRPKSGGPGSRKDVNLYRTFTRWPHSTAGQFKCLPVIAANMDTTGTMDMSKAFDEHMALVALHKHYNFDELDMFFKMGDGIQNSFLTIGMDIPNWLGVKISPKLVCIDVANGYMDGFVEHCGTVRELLPDAVIMAGNVCTPERTEELIRYGKVDIVKVGIGPGSVCTTRIVTGCGYPQLSAIAECADAAHAASARGYICADGGCKTSGDVAKAFAAGADFVMLGSMLAGTDECEGDWEYEQVLDCMKLVARHLYMKLCLMVRQSMRAGKKSLLYYGMSSHNAQKQYNGESSYRPSEGKAVRVPYKGPVSGVIRQITGGIKSACTMAGADELKSLPRVTTFVRVNKTHNQMYSGGEQI